MLHKLKIHPVDASLKVLFHCVNVLLLQRQLPAEFKLFTNVDKSWRDVMRRTVDRPNALKAATASGVLEMLQAANTSLEKIHKCLEVCAANIEFIVHVYHRLVHSDV